MLSPEVLHFQSPSYSHKIKDFKGKVPVNHNTLTDFNHMVTLVIPDSLKIPEKEVLFDDCEYYKIIDLNIHNLIDTTFLSCFVRSGNFTLLSISTRIDCESNVAITPSGLLILNIDKNTYESLGIEGIASKNKQQYSISVDLTDGTLLSNKSKLEKLKAKLRTLEKSTVIVTWEPPEKEICPSSIAKYFCQIGYSIKVCTPTVKEHTVYSTQAPSLCFDKSDKDGIYNFVEWLGMMVLEGDVATNDSEKYVNSYVYPEGYSELGQVKCLQWKGLFTLTQIQQFFQKLQNCNAVMKKSWIAVYVKRFSDTPVVWKNKDDHVVTTGDSGYFIIFNSESGVIVTHTKLNKFL